MSYPLWFIGRIRGFPQLEWWNAGIMGLRIMQYWVNGKIKNG